MDTTHPTRLRYLEAFKTVAQRFELDANANTAAAEDYQLVLDGDLPITRFVAVTTGGESITYVAPAGDTLEEATAKAIAEITDRTYAEAPIAVVDLDNGNTYRPDWTSTKWTLNYTQLPVPQRPTGVFDPRTTIEFLHTALRPSTNTRFSIGGDFFFYTLAWLLAHNTDESDWNVENARHAVALVSNDSD